MGIHTGCNSAVGVAPRDFALGSLLGMDENSWSLRLDPISYCSTGTPDNELKRREGGGGNREWKGSNPIKLI